MHLQPSHFSFGPQQGAFYRKQFVIWARVLIYYKFNCAENKGTYGLLSTGIMVTNEWLCMQVFILCLPLSCFSLFTVGTFLLSGLNIMALPVSHGMRRAVEDLWGSGSGNIGSVCHVTFTSLKLPL